MTEQAPPDYYFQNIIFNPKYYDNEVNNNITTYEADNTYLKKPINQSTGLVNSVLTLTNTTTKEMQWTTPAVAITNYVNFDSGTSTLISNVSGTPTTITTINTSINTTGTLQSRGLTIKNTSNVDVATISNLGALVCSSLNSSSGLVQTTGNLQSRGLTIKNTSNVDVATISNLGALVCSSLNSSSGLVQTTGNLQSRGLTIKNASNVDVATISNLGALVCTSIQNNNNTLNCGNITSGTINSGAINANANLIETTGNLQSRGLAIKNASNVDVATLSNLGALVCTSIQNNNNTLNCGNITSGTINSGAINANANLIETTGNIQSRGLTIKNASNTDVSTISIAGAITGTSLSAGTGTISTSGAINGGAITGTSLSGGNGLISTTNSLQSRGLTVKNTSNADVCTISNLGALVCTSIQNNNNTLNCGNITSGTINSGAINANANLIETTGNIQSRGLTIKNVSNTNVCTISNVGNINITGAYSGADYIYTSNGNIQTALGDIYTNNGELRSRRLVIKNTSDAIVATISNLGELVCTSIQNNNNTLNCGNITSGTINSGAINANTNLIETTGGLQSRGLAIRNTSNADVCTISNLGALVCTSIQNNNNTLNCGNITSGTINSGAINANTNLIETTGGLQSRGLAIRNTSNADVATISNLGALVCTSINSSSGLVQTTGNLQSRGLTIRNTSNADVATISNLGALVCTSINSSSGLVQTTGNLQSRGLTIKDTSNSTVATISNLGVLTCFDIINGGMLTSRGLTIKNNLNVDVATITTDGILTCKEFQNNGNTLYCGDITCGSINSGSSTITGYNLVSTISVTAPAINSSAPNLNIIIGGTQTSGRIDIGNNTSRTGAINIATTVTGNQNINIGNSSSTQTININRPIRLPGLLYTSGSEIGYTQNDAVFFSTGSGNPVIPNTRMNTQITATNLINNANYMIKYSLLIVPQANFNVTRFQYGLYDTGFMTSLSQNPTALSGTTTTLRFDTSDVYSYSGSGFFRYDNTKTYNLSFIMAFLATAPNVQTNIDLIRIS